MYSAVELPIEEQDRGPLNATQRQRLTQAIQGLSSGQLNWASGYLAGLGAHLSPAADIHHRTAATLLYASQTGNGKLIAERLADTLNTKGRDVRILPVTDFRPRDLAKEQTLILVVSTHGEGEPPESALELYRFVHGPRAPRLDSLHFAVFGLGDSSYQHFCKAARDFDKRLEELGGKRLLPRVDADVDFGQPSRQWIGEVVKKIGQQRPLARLIPMSESVSRARISRDHPYTSILLERRPITTDNALSEVHHLVLSGDPAALEFTPGDALGVWFGNDPCLVDEVLSVTGADGDQPVELEGGEISLREALSERLELTQIHPSVARRWGELAGAGGLGGLPEDSAALRKFCGNRQLIDLLCQYPVAMDASTLAALLQPMQPRLYSIASSQAEFEDEVHLTVSVVSYLANGRPRLGGASGHLGRRLGEGEPLRVYVAENTAFRLPDSGDTPIIMIGAGTGIAPYRAFLQQRAVQGDRGRNWLFFGNRHFHRDFLYQQDWLRYRKSGLLDRVTPAFSRTRGGGAYVQDRLLESGKEVYAWLQEGAKVYVCGGSPMENAVRETLTRVVEERGGLDPEQAGEYIDNLRRGGRYQRDVY